MLHEGSSRGSPSDSSRASSSNEVDENTHVISVRAKPSESVAEGLLERKPVPLLNLLSPTVADASTPTSAPSESHIVTPVGDFRGLRLGPIFARALGSPFSRMEVIASEDEVMSPPQCRNHEGSERAVFLSEFDSGPSKKRVINVKASNCVASEWEQIFYKTWEREQTFLAFFGAIAATSYSLLPIFYFVCDYEPVPRNVLMIAMAGSGTVGVTFVCREGFRGGNARQPSDLALERFLSVATGSMVFLWITFLPTFIGWNLN